jgi:hypothetical protein
MLDKARAHRRKKAAEDKGAREELPLLDTKIAGDFLRSVTKRLPELRQQLGPILSKGREKLGDAYSSVAQVLAAKKEAFEDHLAEKRHGARAKKHESSDKPPAEEEEP